MAHPVVLMAYDKSPAITKAVAALEEAGLEVVVLNTKTAKLMNFLGALAGENPDEEDDETAEEPPVEEPAPEEEPAEDLPPEEEEEPASPVTEVLLNDEKVVVEIVDGNGLMLFPSECSGGHANSKARYWINESEFAFWSNKLEGEPLKTRGMLTVGEAQQFVEFTVMADPQNPPVLRIGRDWLKEALPQGWPVLPASQAVFDKSKVTPDEVDSELNHTDKGKVMIIARSVDAYPEPKTSIIMMPGASEKVGKSSPAYHDQTFGKLGTFTVVGHLVKGDDGWKLESDKKIPGLETPEQIKKFKAPVYVFK